MSESALPRAVEGPDGRHTASAAIKIDKGVPFPPGASRGPIPKYPWGEMAVGDSFAVPLDDRTPMTHPTRRAAGLWASRHGVRFATRTVTENGERVVRVWRVA